MKHFIRVALYILGFFFLALGVNLAIISDLGVSPVSSVPLSLHNITGITMGTLTTMMFIFFVLMQVVILRRSFKIINLLQMGFGVVFGYFVDFTRQIMLWISVGNYFGQLFLLLTSSFFVALGLMFIISMKIMPGAPEGFILAICEITKIPFPKMKVWFDSISVLIAVALSLLFIGNISSIREGTIISALIIGKILGIMMKVCNSSLEALAFYPEKNQKLNKQPTKSA